MADEAPKGAGPKPPGDLESLKARLGLKTPRRAPVVEPVPPPAPEPAPATPPQAAPPAAVSVPAPPPPPVYRPRVYEPPPHIESVVEERPRPKSAWQRWGKTAVFALIPAVLGTIVGYVFAKGSTRGNLLAKVRDDARKIVELVKGAYVQVEEIGAAIDPAFAAARRGRQELPPLRPPLRRQVDWNAEKALAAIQAPKELEQIFETDYKRFNRLTVRLLNSFFVDFTRLAQLVRDHVERTKSVKLALEAEVQAGQSPRAYGVIVQSLPSMDRGEVVVLRGRRMVKKGQEEVPVFDVARRRDPGTPIAVPGSALVILDAPGLFKDSGALLEEYNRRLREIGDVVRRLLDIQRSLVSAVERIGEMKV